MLLPKCKGYAWFTDGEEVKERNGGGHIGTDNSFFHVNELDSDVDLNLFETGV